MKLLGLIPARAGSKRLPGKNVKMLGDKPLLAWTIEAAIKSGVLIDVLVSTDDVEIAEIATDWGGWVPWLRPTELATDTATSIDVVIHALNWYEAEVAHIDGLMLLQPTSPFRRPETIRQAAALYEANQDQSVISFSPALSHPAWTFKMQNDLLVPFMGEENLKKRSQDLDPAFVLNGAIFLASPAKIREQKSFLTGLITPIIMNNADEVLDIDTPEDWRLAEFILGNKGTDLPPKIV